MLISGSARPWAGPRHPCFQVPQGNECYLLAAGADRGKMMTVTRWQEVMYLPRSSTSDDMILGVSVQVKDFLVRLVEWKRPTMKALSKV